MEVHETLDAVGNGENNVKLESLQQVRVTEDGRSLRVQTDLPHLVSLGAGRLSTTVTLLPLPPGKTRIGSGRASVRQDIVLQGPGIHDQHCFILNDDDDDVVMLHPLTGQLSVDGVLITTPTKLVQGCMLCIGQSHYFRFNHPVEAYRLKKNLSSNYHEVPKNVPVNRFRERVGLQCVDEGQADDDVDDSQTGVYDNVENVQQQLTQQRRRSRRDQYLNHVAAAGAAHDDVGGTSSPTVAVSDGGAAASGTDRSETASALNSTLSGDVDGWTTSIRRRGRCADRLTSNRVVGPSFVSSTRVQLGGNSGIQQQQQQQQQLQKQFQQQSQQHQLHSEQFLSSSDAVDSCYTATSMPKLNNESTSTTIGEDCIQTGQQPAGFKPEPLWNGYDNIIELKQAIFSSAVAKMAAGSKAKSGVAGSTSCGAGERLPPISGRATGERVVDVHRQRLSAAGREPTSVDHGVQPTTATTSAVVDSSAAEVIVSSHVSSEMDTVPTTSADAGQTHDQKTNCDAARADVDGSHTAYTDNSVTNDGSQQKKTISFEREDADLDEKKVAASKDRKQKNEDKPPIGKTVGDTSKKVGKKSELRKEKKERKSAAESETVSEQQDDVVGKTDQPVSKISFLKSLLTRSRSPSPKRCSPTSSNKRSASPLSLGRDVAKRLSDPLKVSFKQTPDAPVVKVSVKQREKKTKKQPTADDKKNRSEQTSDVRNNSVCKGVSMVNSSDERVDETVTPSSTEEVRCSLTVTPGDRSDIAPSSNSENTPAAANSTSGYGAEKQETTNTSLSSVTSQSTESAVVLMTVPTSLPAGVVSSASEVVDQSSERRRSATVITLRSADSSGSESTTNRISASQTAATLPCSEPRNPWMVNLKEFRMRPNLDSFEGEKVFQKGTVTTRLVLPGFARSQQDFPTSCDGELRSETMQRLTTTTRKSPSERRDRHSAITSPIYDTVYEEHPSSIYKSTTELTGNRYQSSMAQRADDIGKSYSLQDLKLRAGMRQTGDTATAGRIRTMEHAIDDHESRNYAGYTVRSRGDCSSGLTTPSKPVKTVTFRDDVDTNCPFVERRLESVQGLSKTETSTDGKVSKDSSAALSGATLPLPDSRTHTPVVGHVNADRCVKMTKSSSLPARGQPTVHSGVSVDLRNNVSALRDTITSCDLEELPKYMADLYRQHKLERQREQELAARDRERLENIEKMWKEFDSQLTIPASVANSVTNNDKAADGVADVSHLKAEAIQRTREQQIDKSFDELLEEFDKTVRATERRKDFSTANDLKISSSRDNITRPGRSAGDSERADHSDVGFRPRSSSCSQAQRPPAQLGAALISDRPAYTLSALRRQGSGGDSVQLGAGGSQLRSVRYTPPSPGRTVPVTVDDDFESVWTAKTNGSDDVASGSDVDDNSSSFSSSVADPSNEWSSSRSELSRDLLLEERLNVIHEQVRQKQAAIRALEEEREQCLDMERRLQTEMRCGRRAVGAAGTEDGGGCSDDGGKMLSERRPRRPRGYASDDERELSALTTRPLTRYLPVRETPLDLRQFVEAAGHNLAQCGHVEVTSSTCHGYLSKMGRKLRTWNRRWFVFDRCRRRLDYYADKLESRASARGSLAFPSIQDVYVDHRQTVRSPNPTLTFCVKTTDRTLYLMAPSPEAMRIWIDVIFTGAEGYQQFL